VYLSYPEQMSVLPDALIGCLLDVSGSMRNAFGSRLIAEGTVERLHAIFGAALQIAEAEQRRDSHSLMFVAAFGLLEEECPPVVDLCSIAEILLADYGSGSSGHDLLVSLARQRKVAHVAVFIKERLTEPEARLVFEYLQHHPEHIDEFINTIPSQTLTEVVRRSSMAIDRSGSIPSPKNRRTTLIKTYAGINKASKVVDRKIATSKALRMARHICVERIRTCQRLRAYPVDKVVDILRRVHEQFKQTEPDCDISAKAKNVWSTLQRYIYGDTPMRAALGSALAVFRSHLLAKRRMLVLISDGASTDGDPRPLARDLHDLGVTMATIYMTNNENIAGRRLYDQAAENWTERQSALFAMASKVSSVILPIPVLASSGWDIPVSGECALYAAVSCTTVLTDFCSMLQSGHFVSTNIILDSIGRVAMDAFVNDQHVRAFNNPSNQGETMTCYAHATAAAIHMALARIVDRKEGYPAITDIWERILRAFPVAKGVRSLDRMLKVVLQWYPPLRYSEVDEIGARQAVIRRRPVLSSFALSSSGWTHFCDHFKSVATRKTVLTLGDMMPHRYYPPDGAHAVVMTGCAPKSLTFLNSWGYKWGCNGSFSVEGCTVLEVNKAPYRHRMRFYDIFWFENDLHKDELDAYDVYTQRILYDRAGELGMLERELQCPLCGANEHISWFRGDARQLTCLHCNSSFEPGTEHFLQSLYLRMGSMTFTPPDSE
jgi:hypothetical protein